MKEEELVLRLQRFERTVATCLCALPLLFSAQCLLAALGGPVFATMFANFGAELPWLTRFVLGTWPVWAVVAVTVPVVSLLIARRGKATFSIGFSTIAGVGMFVISQVVTLALFLPVFELGSVAGGVK